MHLRRAVSFCSLRYSKSRKKSCLQQQYMNTRRQTIRKHFKAHIAARKGGHVLWLRHAALAPVFHRQPMQLGIKLTRAHISFWHIEQLLVVQSSIAPKVAHVTFKQRSTWKQNGNMLKTAGTQQGNTRLS